MSFVLFALFLVIVLWGLSNFFISTYYERARTQEVIRTADALEVRFRQAAEDDFDSYAVQTAGTNGIYIRIDTPDGSLIYDGTRTVKDTGAFGSDISRIRNRLESSSPRATIRASSTPRI